MLRLLALAVVWVAYAGPITLTDSAEVKARVWDGRQWSALYETTYLLGPLEQVRQVLADDHHR